MTPLGCNRMTWRKLLISSVRKTPKPGGKYVFLFRIRSKTCLADMKTCSQAVNRQKNVDDTSFCFASTNCGTGLPECGVIFITGGFHFGHGTMVGNPDIGSVHRTVTLSQATDRKQRDKVAQKDNNLWSLYWVTYVIFTSLKQRCVFCHTLAKPSSQWTHL